jgi:hypothetical protein
VTRHRILIAGALATLAVLLSPPIPQDPDYHVMADQRTCLGIANCFFELGEIVSGHTLKHIAAAAAVACVAWMLRVRTVAP